MPLIKKFIIEEFKGIKRVEIDLEGKSTSPVLTLIGLNESGKTTILEAISHFVSGDRSVASLFEGQYATASGYRLIPMHKKAAFTGKAKIQAIITLDSEDISELEKIARSHKLTIDRIALEKSFSITREFSFEDSVLKKTINRWGHEVIAKTQRGKKFLPYERPEEGSDETDLWLKFADHIESKLQRVSYFPTFLVDMPARIYLEEHEYETAINRHYRYVFQDILNSLDENLSLEKHVCKRIREFRDAEKTASWLSIFLGSASKGPIDSVFQKISSAITKEVLGSWQRVFQRSISANSISVEWSIDSEKDNVPYATFLVSDGESRYAINERSLGFRWFFSFLLFTAFKKTSDKKTIFIFDEPAANLHAKAQAELLTSFSRIASGGNKIIYSTHSHHMINPRWLGSAYIIENAALDYDKSDNFGLDTKPTQISATPYRQFVSKFPTRSSYFQPVIEKLEYIAPEIIGAGPYVIVEGISDYYALELARRMLGEPIGFTLMPGVGSGASGPLISQLMGQGQQFVVLLDDDAEGRKAAKRYIDEWFLPQTQVFTLAAVSPDFSGKAIEKLFSPESSSHISDTLQVSGKLTKKKIGWYLAETCASTEIPPLALSATTLASLGQILKHVSKAVA